MDQATKTALLEAEGQDSLDKAASAITEQPSEQLSPQPSQQLSHQPSHSPDETASQTSGPRTEPATPAPNLSPRTTRRGAVGLVFLSLAIALGGVAYFKRHAILNAIRAGTSGESSSQAQQAGSKLRVLYWVDAMNPSQRYNQPGKAPDGMDLVPVYDESGGSAKNLPEGAFRISPEKQQLIGVTYGESKLESVSRTIRAVGRLTYDETKISHVHTKTEGWIDSVLVDYTGQLVKKGDPLITVYSPDLVQTQQEYLLALKGNRELGESDFPEVEASAQSLLQSAKQRLELWDITGEQIKELEKRGTPKKDLTLYSPVDGFVVTRNAYPKQKVTPETELYTIVDLSTIWVMADIYEYEAQNIHAGQNAAVTLSYLPGRTFTGKVNYVYPQVDSATRTLKIRVEVPNPDFALKPDMYANVDIKMDYGRHIVVPQEAVLDSGSAQTVFVALGDGYFEPRKVKVGESANGMAIVLEGLKPGEKVVTSANFLVDSESKLKSVAGGMGVPGMPGMNSGGEGGKPQRTDQSQDQPAGAASIQPSPRRSTQPSSGGKTMVMPDGSTMVMPDEPAKRPARPTGHSSSQPPPNEGRKQNPGGRTMVMPDGSTMEMPAEPSNSEHQAPSKKERSADEHKRDSGER